MYKSLSEAQNELRKRLERHGTFWSYPGKGPHVVLPSGKHSNVFFDGNRVVSYPDILSDICYWLAREFRSVYQSSIGNVRWIVGADVESIKIADGVARHLVDFLQLPIRASYARRGVDGEIVFDPAFAPESGDDCVLVKNVITDDSYMYADQILANDGIVFPVRLAILNMTGNVRLPDGEKIISVISPCIPNSWAPEECPLCKKGSEAIVEPKKQENWDRLVASGTL